MIHQKKQKTFYRAAKGAHGEVKGRFNVTLTQSVVDFLDEQAEQMGLSRSELMEQVFRSLMVKNSQLLPDLAKAVGTPPCKAARSTLPPTVVDSEPVSSSKPEKVTLRSLLYTGNQ